jgi:predicted small integral membrane protein
MIRILLTLFIAGTLCNASEYFGVPIGHLKNTTYGISAEVWLVNETTIQLTNFDIAPSDDLNIGFFFSTIDDVQRSTKVYRIVSHPDGDYSKPIAPVLDNGFRGDRLIVTVPSGNYRSWTFFGVVAEKSWRYLAAVRLTKHTAPQPFCCLASPTLPHRGIVGSYYNAGTGPIAVLDAKTIVLKSFTFQGTKPPDGWIYAGKGNVDQETGKKAFVVGRDTPQRHCSLKEDYDGSTDLTVRLADNQTIYDIDYLAVFCYQYSVDFGHISVNFNAKDNPLPAFIPPVAEGPLKTSTVDTAC